MSRSFVATVAPELTGLLAAELRELGATDVSEHRAGVSFGGDLRLAYRVCLWSRLAGRVLMPLGHFAVDNADTLYEAARTLAWEEHLATDGTLAVDLQGSAPWLRHPHFGAQRVKDAVVDRLRRPDGQRPSVERQRPDVRLSVYLHRGDTTISLDLAGESLHRRGYRIGGAPAPLKENLAAAILRRAGWDDCMQRGMSLLDPMCGSGTLVIEAALWAADIAPGLQRDYFGFLGWRGHNAAAWQALLDEARERRHAGLAAALPPLWGADQDRRAIEQATANAEHAGVAACTHFAQQPLHRCELPPGPGLVVTNPPYGERLGERDDLPALFTALGEMLRGRCDGWHAAVLCADAELGRHLGLRATGHSKMKNGPIACTLLRFEVDAAHRGRRPGELRPARAVAGPLQNRLHKNMQRLARWRHSEEISCYRLYDADLPEYNVAVDIYGDAACVQEYQAPKQVPAAKARARLNDAVATVAEVLELPAERVFVKTRRRQKDGAQYGKLAEEHHFEQVSEAGHAFWVNFTDYLDTGLFLDHRPTRALVASLARDRRFLNLFCYTGTATVYAAAAGAESTISVDMSQTYLRWAERNLRVNGLTARQHRLVRADCLAWLAEPERRHERYDLIFLDPPTFSRGKRMQSDFDVQRDYVTLLQSVAQLLSPSGVLLFSTNFRRFQMNAAALKGVRVDDISARTIPPDFARNPRIHRCYRITSAQNGS